MTSLAMKSHPKFVVMVSPLVATQVIPQKEFIVEATMAYGMTRSGMFWTLEELSQGVLRKENQKRQALLKALDEVHMLVGMIRHNLVTMMLAITMMRNGFEPILGLGKNWKACLVPFQSIQRSSNLVLVMIERGAKILLAMEQCDASQHLRTSSAMQGEVKEDFLGPFDSSACHKFTPVKRRCQRK
ncbi:hypothetical protein HAX54_024602 [Datura stramonium]|uniref:Uncharacterized protein n=1 Tax=Datura stramonium TaxID=4076 RepID=A0ABS8RGP1_DATST|nr:hypothetical protein [Datura stramonium]